MADDQGDDSSPSDQPIPKEQRPAAAPRALQSGDADRGQAAPPQARDEASRPSHTRSLPASTMTSVLGSHSTAAQIAVAASMGTSGSGRGAGTKGKARGRRVKRSTRLHQALRFLTSIPLGREFGDADASARSSDSDSDSSGADARNAVSIRLRGKKDFEYVSLTDRAHGYGQLDEQRFKEVLLDNGVLDSRVFFAASKGYPLSVFSVIKYEHSDNVASKPRLNDALLGDWLTSNGKRHVPSWDRWKGTSYAENLHTTWGICNEDRDARHPHPLPKFDYDPNYIDPPEIQQNKDKKMFAMHAYRVTVIPFVKENQLKAKLNATFRQRRDWIPPEITLSKIRNLKRLVLMLWYRLGLDVATIALAHVCFEKLIYLHSVTKSNRRLLMAACVLLAHKFSASDVKSVNVLTELERALRVPRKQILKAEFKVFARLEFSLFVPPLEYDTHFKRLLAMLDVSEMDYLGRYEYEKYAEVVRGAPDSVASTMGDSADSMADYQYELGDLPLDFDSAGGDSSSGRGHSDTDVPVAVEASLSREASRASSAGGRSPAHSGGRE